MTLQLISYLRKRKTVSNGFISFSIMFGREWLFEYASENTCHIFSGKLIKSDNVMMEFKVND
jgi:hypothetical protein